jgi:hypothetical protein
MRSLFSIVLLLVILFFLYNGNFNKTISDSIQSNLHKNIVKVNEDELKKIEEIHVSEQDIEESKIIAEKIENAKKEGSYHQSQNIVERVVTNVLTDFVKTPTGYVMAKNLLTPQNQMNITNQYISTSGYNKQLEKYKLEHLRESEGAITNCGQRIKLQYIITDSNETVLDSKVTEYRVGKHNIEEFNILPIGLRTGGLSKAKFFSTRDNISLQNIFVTLSVLKHIDNNDINTQNIKIFDEYISNNRPIQCADNIRFDFKLSEISGKTISEGSKELKLGDTESNHVLSYLLTNMQLMGTRTIIIKAEELKKGKNPIINTEYKQNNYIILELKNPSLIVVE